MAIIALYDKIFDIRGWWGGDATLAGWFDWEWTQTAVEPDVLFAQSVF